MKKIELHTKDFSFRTPKLEDGKAIYELVKQSPPLDLNSLYCYLLLCDHFDETCIIAEYKSKLAGFISAYRHPQKPDTLFVWQVVVAENMRGRGLAGDMLNRILSEKASWASFVETTVTPSNRSSLRFFQAFADERRTLCQRHSYMTKDLFGNGSHEEEILLRIGPFHQERS
ncbi:MAG: diaminobutyrate acetyltransferase [Deltaproteobacteria bacterium]|nr:diaminobutyrate acetyltransferase [Deltaproteobacteria bacterium]